MIPAFILPVAPANFFRRPGALRADIEIAFRAVNENALAFDRVVIGAQKEMDVLVGAKEFRAIKTAQGSGTDNGDLHWVIGFMDYWIAGRTIAQFAAYSTIQKSIYPPTQ